MGRFLGLLLLLTGLFGAPRPAAAYMWEETTYVTVFVANLRITDIYLPKTMRLEWDYAPMGQEITPTFTVSRRPVGGNWTVISPSQTQKYYVDAFEFSFGTDYEYMVTVFDATAASMQLPPPPGCADPNEIFYRGESSPDSTVIIPVTPFEVLASQDGAVDSRYDLRYGNPTFQDFIFSSSIYRGGLFTGFATDPSRVGRSFLKFTLPQLPTGEYLWTGNIHVYYLRSFGSGSTQVGAHRVLDNWTSATLKWSNAPSLNPTAPESTDTLVYDPMNPIQRWAKFRMLTGLAMEISGDLTLSVGLAAKNEAAYGWAYFARRLYSESISPRVLLAYKAPRMVVDVSFDPGSVIGGDPSTGTVTLNAPAPAGGAVVTLSSDSPDIAQVPASVTIPEGQISATFQVTTTEVFCSSLVTITATHNGRYASGYLVVNPACF